VRWLWRLAAEVFAGVMPVVVAVGHEVVGAARTDTATPPNDQPAARIPGRARGPPV
jgi:hypothetical protein